MMLTSTASVDLVNISMPNAAIVALLGYAVVFFGLILLMLVVMAMGKAFIARDKKLNAQTTAQGIDLSYEHIRGKDSLFVHRVHTKYFRQSFHLLLQQHLLSDFFLKIFQPRLWNRQCF